MRLPNVNTRAPEAVGGPAPAAEAPALATATQTPAPVGPWRAGKVSDAGTPLGVGFRVGATVYAQDEGAGVWRLLALGPGLGAQALGIETRRPGATRRRITQTQLLDFVVELGEALPDGTQERLAAAWAALEPAHAGFHEGTQIPRFYRGLAVRFCAATPAVKEKDWQADWDAVRPELYFEQRVWLNPPREPGPEQDAEDIRVTLEHEAEERAAALRIADELAPYAAPADRARLAVENEGLAHAQVIGPVDGFWGPDAEQRYYREADKPFMDRRGFEKETADWPDGGTL